MSAKLLVASWKCASLSYLVRREQAGASQLALWWHTVRAYFGTMGRVDANLTIQAGALDFMSPQRREKCLDTWNKKYYFLCVGVFFAPF